MQKDQRTFTTLFCYLLFFSLWGFVLTSWFSLNTGYPTWQITFSVCDVHLTSSVCKGIDLAEYTTLWTVALFHWLFSCFNIHFFPAFYFYLLLFIHFRENKKQILLKKFTQRACCFSHQHHVNISSFYQACLPEERWRSSRDFWRKLSRVACCMHSPFCFSQQLQMTALGYQGLPEWVLSCNTRDQIMFLHVTARVFFRMRRKV